MKGERPDLGPAAAALLLAAILGGATLFRLLPETLQTFAFGIAGTGLFVLLCAAAIRLNDWSNARAVAHQLRPPEVTLGDNAVAHPAGDPPPHLFHLPWYVVLGRAECGKSSLIRALAGDATPTRLAPGGVDCWATPDAVYIELNTPSSSLSTDEPAINLLSLLKRHRAHRPISGLILALPADRLLKAESDQVAAAATAINSRIDEIREAVAVRFPVYLVMTRADRLLGFREATTLASNQSHAAPWLGWKSPAGADDAPSPELFNDAIESLRAQAIHRRTNLLSPPLSEPLPARALDRLDTAYALPNSISRLAAPLSTLLTGLFIREQQPHLFFRGLFLTAAYPAGPAIDPDAPARAAAIRHDAATPLSPLHPLFTAHILPECNLVTSARSASAAYGRRRSLVAAACMLGAVIPTLVAIGGSTLLQDGPRAHLSIWQSIAARASTSPRLPAQQAALAAADLAHQAFSASEKPIFLLPALPFGDSSREIPALRAAAAQSLFQNAALRPILAAAAEKLAHQSPQEWTPSSTAALVELASLVRMADSSAMSGRAHFIDLSALLTFLSFDSAASEEVSRLADSLYRGANQRAAAQSLVSSQVRGCLAPALTACLSHYDSLAAGRLGAFKQFADLQSAAQHFQSALTDISNPDVQAVAVDWPNLFSNLKSAAAHLDAASVPLKRQLAASPESLSSGSLRELLARAAKDRAALQSAFESNPAFVSQINVAFGLVETAAKQTAASFEKDLPPLIAQNLIPDSRNSDRPFEARLKLFAAANGLLSAPLPTTGNAFGQLSAAISSNTAGADTALATIKLLVDRSPLLREDAATATALVESRRRHILAATLRAATTAINLPAQEFNHLADDFALHAVASLPRLPELPLCPNAGQPIQPRFAPDAAKQIFSDWTAISRLARGQDIGNLPPDELAALLESFDVARATYTRFAADYVKYWSTLPDAVAAPELPTWVQLGKALRSFKPAQANASYRKLLNATSLALLAVPADLDQEDALLAARAGISAEIAELDKPWFDEACRRARDNWAALSPNAEAARATLLKLSTPQFQATYLEIYGEHGRGVRYWNHLMLSSLSALASVDTPSRQIAESLIRDTRLFPLCADADPALALSPAELLDARRRAAAVIKTGLAAVPDSRDRSLADGARTEHELINEQLARLSGAVLSFDDRQDAWSHKLRTVLGFLDPAAPQFCEVFIFDGSDLDPPAPDSTPISADYPALHVSVGSTPALAPLSTTCPGDRAIAFELPGPALTLRLHSADPTLAPLPPIELAGPWNAIILLREPAAMVDDTADASGRLARVPLVITDHAGRSRYLWLGFRFQRPPPALADWPQQADWPD